MLQQSQAKIFLAGERGLTETEQFRSYNTFNFGDYREVNKQPFGPLYVFNDDTLAGGQSLNFFIEHDSEVLLIPSAGAISYRDSLGNENFIEPGQMLVSFLEKGSSITITNPYEKELVNFFQAWIQTPVISPATEVISFDIEKNKNSLVPLPCTYPNNSNHKLKQFSIGKFDGREEVRYTTRENKKGVFVFVIQGAFEVQYRLMEARDGLALWNTSEIEIEALSNEAIILLIEVEMEVAHELKI